MRDAFPELAALDRLLDSERRRMSELVAKRELALGGPGSVVVVLSVQASGAYRVKAISKSRALKILELLGDLELEELEIPWFHVIASTPGLVTVRALLPAAGTRTGELT